VASRFDGRSWSRCSDTGSSNWPPISREVLATSATPVTAHHLEVSAGSPVFMVVLHLYDADGAPVEWMRSLARFDRALAEETLDLATGLLHAS
jgi:DNA-binding GntR family transcriptional regulator